jgi:hypothetical protein
MDGHLLEHFQIISQDDNPVLAGSTTSLFKVQGMLYGIVDSLTSDILPGWEGEFPKETIEKVARGEMRVAELVSLYRNNANLTHGIVCPQTRISDELYDLPGCSIAVTLRRDEIFFRS